MTEEEKLAQFLARQGQDDSCSTEAASLENIEKQDVNKYSESSGLTIESVDIELLSDAQQALETEIALFPRDESLWLQVIQTIKLVSPTSSKSPNSLQDRVWKDRYLRSVYRRMLNGPFKYMSWLWIEYILFEAGIIALQLPSATIIPFPQKTATHLVPPNLSHLEEALACALIFCYSPNIWFVYLNFIKKKLQFASDQPLDPAEQKKFLVDIYEKALDKVGLDIYSGPLWVDYIAYLKSEKTEGLFEEQVKMDHLRKVYQRAVVIPHTHLEGLWREYDTFENQLNKVTAKKILSEKSPLHMNARVAFKELKNKMEAIQRNKLDLVMRPDLLSEQEQAWQKIFTWEKANTCLKLEDTDMLLKRQEYAYRAALSPLCQSNRTWLLYAIFKQQNVLPSEKGFQEMVSVFEKAISILTLDLAAHFYFADVLESAGGPSNLEKAKKIYDSLIESQVQTIDGVVELISKRKTSLAKLEQRKEALMPEDKSPEAIDIYERIDNLMTSLSDLESKKVMLEQENNLTFIQMMRFMRRTEGVLAARTYFGRARKMSHCSSLVFLASAQMEFFIGKEPIIAFKIFELGMKKFAIPLTDIDKISLSEADKLQLNSLFTFFQEYMKLLLYQMDDANAVALFERIHAIYAPLLESNESSAVAAFICARFIILLNLLIEHEKSYGGSNALLNISNYLEKRRALENPGDRLEDDDPITLINEKCRYMHFSLNAESTPIVTSSGSPLHHSSRKRPIHEIDLQPVAPISKKAPSIKRSPPHSTTSSTTATVATANPPIVNDILTILGDFVFDLPAINIESLMHALSNASIPPSLGPLQNPSLRQL
jgi:tetratricopeptide (TPR) repeat protein